MVAASLKKNNAWFAALRKPDLYPPPAIFGVVWSVLYTMMGLAAALLAAARGAALRKWALIAFGAQLLLNLAWSPVFFGEHQITGALVVLAFLDLMVLVTLLLFWPVRPLAGVLLLPYLAWVLFATALNWQFLQINRALDGEDVSGPVMRVEFPDDRGQ